MAHIIRLSIAELINERSRIIRKSSLKALIMEFHATGGLTSDEVDHFFERYSLRGA